MSALLKKQYILNLITSPKYLTRVLLIILTYFAFGRLGLMFDAVSGFASLIWPPTGISIALLFIFGRRYAPAIFLGALFTNLSVGASVLSAVGIGLGNMLEAVIAAYFLRTLNFESKLCCVEDVLSLVLPVAVFSTLISATIGSVTLFFSNIVTYETFMETWVAWWVGDMIGALIFTPVVLVWTDYIKNGNKLALRFHEVMPIIALILVALMVFFGGPESFAMSHLLNRSYLLFIPLIWLTLKFNSTGVVTSLFITALIAVWGTALHSGPFAGADLSVSLVPLQIYIGFLSATILFLYAGIAEKMKKKCAGKH